ncbi:MAG: RNA-binding S4 domain-containing protein [Oscillospiraceae bacterium]|nr:RNA-binding S4 domain-containing protein [Oscillospiraceae bacterium]
MKLKVKVRPSEKVEISTEYIKLDSFLKFAVLVETGGEAKQLIQDGEVKVNGETCLMRGKKLYPGDTVAFAGKKYEVSGGKI